MVSNAVHTIPLVHRRSLLLMGNQFEFTVVANDENWAQQCIQAAIDEVKRIESLLTTFNEKSETFLINQNAGIKPVQVCDETFQLIERALRISDLTQGAFDLSYGSVDRSLWNFDTTMKALPDTATAQAMVRLINYKNIILDSQNRTVFLKEQGMRIGFGGIGKGYAADRAKMILQEMGIEHGVVNASGDLTIWGLQPNGQPWKVGVVDPNLAGTVFSEMDVTGVAIATSGNYEKYIMIDGKRYSHTIDPRTGLPVQGIKSVTIITRNAELADAMATPITIMGVHAGLHLINQINDMEAIIIDDHDRIYCSNNIHLN